MQDDTPPLILASASPRRAELLTAAGFSFVVDPAHVDESVQPGEPPEAYVLRVAAAKASRIASKLDRTSTGQKSASIVLGADTAVVLEGAILGKAETPEDAVGMLRRLAGATHSVYTAVVLVGNGSRVSEVVHTRVHLLPLADDEIQRYVATGEPLGKAGGYAIQGRAARFVDWIEGSWSNVVGLPLATVRSLLRQMPDTQ